MNLPRPLKAGGFYWKTRAVMKTVMLQLKSIGATSQLMDRWTLKSSNG